MVAFVIFETDVGSVFVVNVVRRGHLLHMEYTQQSISQSKSLLHAIPKRLWRQFILPDKRQHLN